MLSIWKENLEEIGLEMTVLFRITNHILLQRHRKDIISRVSIICWHVQQLGIMHIFI